MIEWTPEGALRCDSEGFEELAAAGRQTRGEAVPGGAPELAQRIASEPAVQALLGPVLDPVTQVQCVVADAERLADHRAWLTPSACTFLVWVGDGVAELASMPPAFAPSVLARLVQLEPLGLAEQRVRPVQAELVASLFDDAPGARRSALTAVGAEYACDVTFVWPGGEESVIAVHGAAGRQQVTGSDQEGWALRPATSSALFRAFTRIPATTVQ